MQKYLKPLWVLKTLHLLIVSILANIDLSHDAPLSLNDNVDQINVKAAKAVHVGDDQKADKLGANAVGINCWSVFF